MAAWVGGLVVTAATLFAAGLAGCASKAPEPPAPPAPLIWNSEIRGDGFGGCPGSEQEFLARMAISGADNWLVAKMVVEEVPRSTGRRAMITRYITQHIVPEESQAKARNTKWGDARLSLPRSYDGKMVYTKVWSVGLRDSEPSSYKKPPRNLVCLDGVLNGVFTRPTIFQELQTHLALTAHIRTPGDDINFARVRNNSSYPIYLEGRPSIGRSPVDSAYIPDQLDEDMWNRYWTGPEGQVLELAPPDEYGGVYFVRQYRFRPEQCLPDSSGEKHANWPLIGIRSARLISIEQLGELLVVEPQPQDHCSLK